MTPDLPYIDPFNMSQPIADPPYDLFGSNLSFFPLEANPIQLNSFINAYLNIVPPVDGAPFFKVAAPFVFLIIANYQEGANKMFKLGVISPKEFGFGIPLTRYRCLNGRLRYETMGLFFPFIWVSDIWAVLNGREIYGWPKDLGWFTATRKPMITPPNFWRNILSLQTHTISRLFAGNPSEIDTLIEIERSEYNPLNFPPDLTDLRNVIYTIPRQINCLLQLFSQVLDLNAWLLNSNQPLAPLDFLVGLQKKFILDIEQGHLLSMAIDLFTLKQSRDVQFQDEATYRSILASKMRITGIKEANFLNLGSMLSGDLSGGYRIRLNLYKSAPILDILGLKVAELHQARSARTPSPANISRGPRGRNLFRELQSPDSETSSPDDDPQVAILTPALPFSLLLDVQYTGARALAWQTRNSGWYIGSRRISGPLPKRKPLYNTNLRGAVTDITGGFLFSDVTKRILALPAHKKRLNEYCRQYLNSQKSPFVFKAIGDEVLFIVTSYSSMTSFTENIANWARREAQFAILVKYYHKSFPQYEHQGLLVPVTFTDSEIIAFTQSEVLGFPTRLATLQSPESTWNSWQGPHASQPVLFLWTVLEPALNLGQKPENRLLLDVRRDPLAKPPAHNQAHNPLRQHLESTLHNRQFDSFALKQIRSAGNSARSVYQSIVKATTTFISATQLQPIPGHLTVRIHQCPSFSIVGALGLKFSQVQVGLPEDPHLTTQGDAIFEIHPSWASWFVSDIWTGEGETLAWRDLTHNGRWQLPKPHPSNRRQNQQG